MMRYVSKLPDPKELSERYALNEEEKEKRIICLKSLKHILKGEDERKILIIGPCSADREDAVLEYVCRLAKLQEMVKERLLIIPRVYTSKPRTNGKGYKGLLHRPYAGKADNLISGMEVVRDLHVKVVHEAGMFAADELLYPELYTYLEDVLVYMAVGARSVEDQQHRLIASGMDIPIGMKNPTSGNINVMLNSIVAAQTPQHLIFNGWEVETDGNPYTHAILRGYTSDAGEDVPNYYYENICKLHDRYYHMDLKNPSVIIDCNHSNSGKRYEEQIRIAEDVMDSCGRSKGINRFVKGLMIESYLCDGNQLVGENKFGCSITDPCLGWKKTESLVKRLADVMGE